LQLVLETIGRPWDVLEGERRAAWSILTGRAWRGLGSDAGRGLDAGADTGEDEGELRERVEGIGREGGWKGQRVWAR
jgi:hypothetical protein